MPPGTGHRASAPARRPGRAALRGVPFASRASARRPRPPVPRRLPSQASAAASSSASSAVAWSRWYARTSSSSAPSLRPLGEALVVAGPRGLREAAVGDLADQHVLELVCVLAGDRRAGLRRTPRGMEVHPGAGRCRFPRGRAHRAPLPEDPAHHGGALQQLFPAEAGGRSGRRSAPAACRGSARSRRRSPREHPDGFLDEERVALALVEDRLTGADSQLSVEQGLDQRLAVGAAPAAPARSPSHAGRRSSRDGRAARAAPGTAAGSERSSPWTCARSARAASSAQWMSSKTSTSGCGSASFSAHSRAPPAISCWFRSPFTASRTPDARASRSAGLVGQQSRSFSSASSSRSSSAIRRPS